MYQSTIKTKNEILELKKETYSNKKKYNEIITNYVDEEDLVFIVDVGLRYRCKLSDKTILELLKLYSSSLHCLLEGYEFVTRNNKYFKLEATIENNCFEIYISNNYHGNRKISLENGFNDYLNQIKDYILEN